MAENIQPGDNLEEYKFKPQYNRDLTKRLIKNYYSKPSNFNENLVSQIEEHANHYGMWFNRDPSDEEFKMLESIKQAGSGFIEGFTTLEVGEQPKNQWEGIARSLGHLGGFVGYIPGAAAKSSIGVLRALSYLKGKSVPMMAAKAVTEPVSKHAAKAITTAIGKRSEAVSTVSKLLYNDTARDMAEGAFHLGTASAVSSWTKGVDVMVDSFIHGGVAGGAFRGIGNLLKSAIPGENALGENALGSIAGALFQGLPSTMRGATAPEQIYEYLLGAYFGFKESPSARRTAMKYRYQDLQKEVTADKMLIKLEKDLLQKDWSPETKKVVEQYSRASIQKTQVTEMIKRFGEDYPYLKEAIDKGFVSKEEVSKILEERTEAKVFSKKTPDFYTIDKMTPEYVQKNKDKVFIFADDFLKRGSSGNASVRNEPNAFGIPTKRLPGERYESFFTDDDFVLNKRVIQKAIEKIPKDKPVVIPTEGFGNTQRSQLSQRAPRTYKFLQDEIAKLHKPKLGEAREEVEKALETIAEREDTGVQIQIDAMPRIKSWAEDNLSFSWIRKDGSIDAARKKVSIEDLHQKLLEKAENFNDDINELSDWMKNRYGEKFDMSNENAPERNFFRNYLKRRIGERNMIVASPYVTFNYTKGKNDSFTFKDIKDIKISHLDPESPQNMAGDRKSIPMVNFYVEEVYRKEMNNTVDITDASQRPIIRVDGVVQKGGNGVNKEVGLLQFRENIYNDLKFQIGEKKARETAEKAYNELIGNMHQEMLGKGMYYFGGKADSEVMIYNKWHPRAEVLTNQEINNNKDLIIKSMKLDKNHIDTDMRDFRMKYSKFLGGSLKANELYNRGMVSNVFYNLSMNGLKPNIANYKKIAGEGFINDPISLNKRLQVWFTNGHSVDPEYLKHIPDIVDGNLNTIILKTNDDIPKGFGLRKKPWEIKKNTDNIEHFDGGSPIRDDVLIAINKEAGLHFSDNESGQNKNFIISAPEDGPGALLGKHMHFDAGPRQSKAMESLGLHQMLPTTSAKQYGSRKGVFGKMKDGKFEFWDYDAKGKRFDVSQEQLMRDYMFQVNSKDLRVILSEVVSSKSGNKDQRLPKQIGSTLSTISPGVTPEIINEFFTDYNLKSFKGEDRYNKMLSEYLASKDPKLMKPLIDNIEKIGASELAEALTEPGFGDFQVEVYRKMLRINKDAESMAIEEGEKSEREYTDVMKEMNEYTSVSDRNLALAGDHISVFLNKMNNPYREAILKNYIVHQVTRPKVPNSVASRMRVYDYEFQDNPLTKRLQTEKDIYFLDDGHRHKKHNYDNLIATLEASGILKSQIDSIRGTRNLGELWDLYNKTTNPVLKEEIPKFFEALTTRVPIDSISGTAALKFGGFTGRKGFGGLIHGEIMRKLGGADADGDKMWLFMDVKSKYKDVYNQNKDEFLRYYKKSQYGQKGKKDVLTPEEFSQLSKDKKINPDDWYEGVSDNKEGYRKDFTVTTGSNINLRRSPSLMYSMNHRKTISDIAADGRNRLGPAVVAKQNLIALYTDKINELADSESKTFDIDVGDKNKTTFTVKLKTEKTALKKALEKLRASIAFPSDPLDEIGIVNPELYYSRMFDSLFEVTSAKNKTGKMRTDKVTSFMKRKAVQNYSNINTAYYGKDIANNRQWRYHERKEKAGFINNIPADSRISFISKQADTLKDVDWQDGYQKRVNLDSVQQLYTDYNEEVRRPENKKIANAFYRGGFVVPFNKNIARFLQGRLEGDKLKQGEDFFSNDLSVMTGYKTGIEYWRQLPKEKLQELALEADAISKDSYLLNRESEGSYEYVIKDKKGEVSNINQAQKEALDKAKIEYTIESETPLPKRTRSVNQAETDAAISKYKESLTDLEQDAFDALLLSGFRIPYANELKTFYGLRNKKDKSFIEEIAMETSGKNINATGVNRLGFSSKSISDRMVSEYWDNYKKLFNETTDPISESLKKDLLEISRRMSEPVDVKVEDTSVKADLGEGREAKLETLRALDKIPAFRRVAENKNQKRVPLSSENQRLYNEILDHLDFYGPSIGLKVEGYMKNLFLKSPDAMTIEDMRAFNHLLGSRRSGQHLGWLGKQFVKWTKGDPILSKYFYNTFPMTSDKAWLRKDFKLVERIGMFWNPLDRKAETGIIYEPAHAMGQLNYAITNLGDFAMHEKRRQEDIFRDKLQFLNAITEGQELAELAAYQRELPVGLKLDAFKASDLSMNAKARTYGVKDGKLQDKILKRIAAVDKKVFNVRFGSKTKEMTGQQIMDEINKLYSKTTDNIYNKWLRGNPKTLSKYIYRDENGIEQARLELFTKDMMDAIKENIAIDKVLDIGVDGMNRIGTHLQLKMTRNPKLQSALRRRLEEMGTKYRKDFFPHVNFEGKHIEKALQSAMDD